MWNMESPDELIVVELKQWTLSQIVQVQTPPFSLDGFEKVI